MFEICLKLISHAIYTRFVSEHKRPFTVQLGVRGITMNFRLGSFPAL